MAKFLLQVDFYWTHNSLSFSPPVLVILLFMNFFCLRLEESKIYVGYGRKKEKGKKKWKGCKRMNNRLVLIHDPLGSGFFVRLLKRQLFPMTVESTATEKKNLMDLTKRTPKKVDIGETTLGFCYQYQTKTKILFDVTLHFTLTYT